MWVCDQRNKDEVIDGSFLLCTLAETESRGSNPGTPADQIGTVGRFWASMQRHFAAVPVAYQCVPARGTDALSSLICSTMSRCAEVKPLYAQAVATNIVVLLRSAPTLVTCALIVNSRNLACTESKNIDAVIEIFLLYPCLQHLFMLLVGAANLGFSFRLYTCSDVDLNTVLVR
jgi:hypothetical protein